MNREEVIQRWDSMTARERDAWVCEAVMGLELSDNMLAAYPKYKLPEHHGYIRAVPEYTVAIYDAWEVVEKMKKG